MATPIPDSLERLSQSDLIGVVRDLIGEVGRLRAENEKLSDALTKLKAEHQAAKDELARLKKLPPRPPQKPSGMDKATDGGGGNKSRGGATSHRRRGSQLDRLTIGATVIVRAQAPAGSRHKGYEDIVVQDLNLSPQVTLYRRERWETPEGERIIAELDLGIVGGYGPQSVSVCTGAAPTAAGHVRIPKAVRSWCVRDQDQAPAPACRLQTNDSRQRRRRTV